MPLSRFVMFSIVLFIVCSYLFLPEFAYSETGNALIEKAAIVFVILAGIQFFGGFFNGKWNEDEVCSYSFGGKLFFYLVLGVLCYGFVHFLLKVDPLGVIN